MFVVFSARVEGSDPDFAAKLFIGNILFVFMQEGVVFGMNSLLDMSNILLKINFPRQIAILSSVVMAAVNFGINIIVIFVFTFALGYHPTLKGVGYFAFIALIIFLLEYGISLFMSIIMVRVRDMTHIVELGFQLLMWGSGIFYSIDDMKGMTGEILRLNPLAILIDAGRRAFLKNEIVNPQSVFLIFGVTIVIVILGQIYFSKKIRRVAEYF
jgi:ABC-2 type transport system permease protein